MPIWAPEDGGPKGSAGHRGEAPSAHLAAGPRPGWLHHIVYRLANRQIFHKPYSSSHAWAFPVQLFQHLFLLKCIYYTERNHNGVGSEASKAVAGAYLRASFENNHVGDNSALFNLATACPSHWGQKPLDIGPAYKAEREKPQMVFGGLHWSLSVSSMTLGKFLNL